MEGVAQVLEWRGVVHRSVLLGLLYIGGICGRN